MCHEPCGDIKEDCLYLNVFTPKDTLDSGRKTGVAIWFHGGFRDSDIKLYSLKNCEEYWVNAKKIITVLFQFFVL